jgi:hypothetical protein
MQGENWLVATPMLTMLPCPLGGFTLVRSYSPDIIKIESPSEYATVVHPQIELKHQMRVPY